MIFILLVAAIGSALIGGVFFAFSTFVMRALAQLPDVQGIAAMQRINVVVINPLFLGAFLGIALLSLGLIISLSLAWSQPESPPVLIGGIAYLLGSFGVTMAFNVPRNERLARLDADTPAASQYWRSVYLVEWVLWNHVRTAASVIASVLFVVGLLNCPT